MNRMRFRPTAVNEKLDTPNILLSGLRGTQNTRDIIRAGDILSLATIEVLSSEVRERRHIRNETLRQSNDEGSFIDICRFLCDLIGEDRVGRGDGNRVSLPCANSVAWAQVERILGLELGLLSGDVSQQSDYKQTVFDHRDAFGIGSGRDNVGVEGLHAQALCRQRRYAAFETS
jgi:hypothetical protein